jgi:hypothetical protein
MANPLRDNAEKNLFKFMKIFINILIMMNYNLNVNNVIFMFVALF